MPNVTTTDIITEEVIRDTIQDAVEETLQFQEAFRTWDVSGMDNDTFKVPTDDDNMGEPEEIPEGTEFPRTEEDVSTTSATVKKYGHEISITREAIDDSAFNVVSYQVNKSARKMQEKLNKLAFDELNANLHTNSPAGNVGDTAAFEFDDVVDAEEELRDDAYNPDLLIVSPHAHADLKTSSEYNRATDLSDREVIRDGAVGRVDGFDVMIDNDGHIGADTSAGYLVDTDEYGFDVVKETVQTNEYDSPETQSRNFQIWTRRVFKAVDSTAAIKINA